MSDSGGEADSELLPKGSVNWSGVWRKSRRYYRLLISIFLIFALGSCTYYLLAKASYTAAAMLGPRNPAVPDSSSLIGGISAAASLLGGTMGIGVDNSGELFDEYSEMLLSRRLAVVLAQKYAVMPLIFDDNWDSERHAWKWRLSRGFTNFINSLVGRPQRPMRDVDDLVNYLEKNLSITLETPVASSSILHSTSLLMVTLKTHSPALSEKILGEILDEADSEMRESALHDVSARIAGLEKAIPKTTNSDEKVALVTVLTSQLDLLSLIKSDKRFASMLLDPPNAPLTPSSPTPLSLALLAIFGSIAVWAALVFGLSEKSRLLQYFAGSWRRVWKRTPQPEHGKAALL